MKRSRLRRVSPKRAKLIRAVGKERAEFKRLFPICWHCRKNAATDVHELTRGVFRANGYGDRRAWMALCRPCHTLYGDYGKVPLVKQLCVKHLNDGEYFSLEWINQARGRAPGAITIEELEQ